MSISRTTIDELAIDFALGLAEGSELERAERLLQTDNNFATDVRYWQERMSEIDKTAPERSAFPERPAAPERPASPERPATTLSWESIEQAIEKNAAPTVTPASTFPPSKPSNQGILAGLWEAIGFWRPAAIAGAFASLLLTVGLVSQLQRSVTQPVYVAVLQTGESRAAAVVNAYADGTVTLVPLETIGVPQGRILEVWTLQTRERGPVSIGRMDQARSLKLDLKSLSKPDVGHLFEITVEPVGGSPTGRPTGPILMKGLASTAL
jgi:anti-sigma-K factor RskA